MNPNDIMILLIYKKSAYQIYFIDNRNYFVKDRSVLIKKEIALLKKSHEVHENTLLTVEATLQKLNLVYEKCYRARGCSTKVFDLIITVGGDGTFLEAASRAENQPLLGVNSDPKRSLGKYCIAEACNFEDILKKVLEKKIKPKKINRLKGSINRKKSFCFVNDILICHKNHAAISRYALVIGREQEIQRSSGIWISTATGSTGAIRSAGGKVLRASLPHGQYRPRELHPWPIKNYRFKGHVLDFKERFRVISLMRKGVIYVDGSHVSYDFSFGKTIEVRLSTNPVKAFLK